MMQEQAATARAWGTDPAVRPVGLETEYGLIEPGHVYANPVVLASEIVSSLGQVSRQGPPVRWDYEAEDPLADLRGGRLDRAAAHPSQLTDDPTRVAPSGDTLGGEVPPATEPPGRDPVREEASGGVVPSGLSGSGAGGDAAPPRPVISPTPAPPEATAAGEPPLPPAPWGTRPRPSAAEAALPRATTAVLTNGARLYVDHAHPEYSSPEVLTPLDAVTWDRAGEVIARRAMQSLAARREQGEAVPEVVLYKNNVDGKGAAYGSHESYLVRRDVPFDDLAAALIPFLVTRPLVAGAGRVGLGQRSQQPGYQISQRADYVETDIGLQTTFNRPIVNTRDEPHADASRWRRLHVINGDANRLDTPIYLKVATTTMLLWYLERAAAHGQGMGALADLRLTGDPVEEQWALSHDLALSYPLATACGTMTGLEIQRAILNAVRDAMTEDGLLDAATSPASALGQGQVCGGVPGEPASPAARARSSQPGGGTFGWEASDAVVTGVPHAQAALALWDEVLAALETYAAACVGADSTERAQALAAAGRDVEWAAKLTLLEALARRTGCGWADPRLAAVDIQWADLRPGVGLAEKMIASGRTRRLVTEAAVLAAADQPPHGTRAWVRGRAVGELVPVVGASWTSLVLDVPGRERLVRVELPEDVVCSTQQAEAILDQVRRLAAGADVETGAK